MEKVRGIDIRDFPSVRLYLDDLAKVVELFSGVCDSVAVKAGDFTITDAQELMLLAEQFPGGVFKDLYIHGKAPYFSLAFYPFGIVLHLNEDTNEMRGVASRLRDILDTRKKRDFRGGVLNHLGNGLGVMGVILMVLGQYYFGAALMLAQLLFVFLQLKLRMVDSVIAHSYMRDSRKSFFERKKDDIILACISSSLGAVLGGVCGYFVAVATK